MVLAESTQKIEEISYSEIIKITRDAQRIND